MHTNSLGAVTQHPAIRLPQDLRKKTRSKPDNLKAMQACNTFWQMLACDTDMQSRHLCTICRTRQHDGGGRRRLRA